ncbi:MAG: hypothetical protein ACREL7_04060 [Longimicrobiales bacterium]
MIRSIAVALAFAASGAIATQNVQAQDYRFAASYNAGAAWFSPLNSGAGARSDVAFDIGWIMGLQFEQWLGSGRTGWRINGALTERPIGLPGGDRDVGMWFADFDLLLRLLPASPDRRVNATLSLGAGLVRYKLGDGDPLFMTAANASYDGDDGPLFAPTGGLSIDVLTGWRWDGDPVGLRLEVVDHVALDSPFQPIGGGDFSPVHNVRFVLGAFTGWGLLR